MTKRARYRRRPTTIICITIMYYIIIMVYVYVCVTNK